MRFKLYLMTTVATMLAFFVVVLGAYTRLTDAGLGCPDWPGCYGHLTPMGADQAVVNARAAWTEMAHRYCAGTVGLLILIINILAFRYRRTESMSLKSPLVLLALVFFQAALGMWTVTLKLHPIVVMSHLLGGLAILNLLWRYRLKLDNRFVTTMSASERRWEIWSLFGLVLLIAQIALGGWVSSNYAGLACVGFPSCNGELLPSLVLGKAFSIHHIGPNFEGGVLASPARVTIQVVHRIGAVITASYLYLLAGLLIIYARSFRLRQIGFALLILTTLQFALGILNVIYLLPLTIAVMHNGIAALLLMTVVTLNSATMANRGEWFHA